MIDYSSHIDGDLPEDIDEYTCPQCGGQLNNDEADIWECQDCNYTWEGGLTKYELQLFTNR